MGHWTKVGTFKNDAKYANPTQTSPLVVAISGHQAGDLAVVDFQYGTSGTTDITGLGVSDDAGVPNTYTRNGTTNFDSGHQQGMAQFRGVVADASVANVSASWSAQADAFLAMTVTIYRNDLGALTGDPLTGTPAEANQPTPGTGVDAVTSGTTTPGVNGALVHCALMYPGSVPATTTHGTGFTLGLDDTVTAQQATEWLEQAVAAAIAGTWTEGTTGQPAMTITSAYAPPTPAATTPPQRTDYSKFPKPPIGGPVGGRYR